MIETFDSEVLYDRKGLLKFLRENGLPITEDRLEYWVKQKAMTPAARSKGRGRPALYTQHQAHLLKAIVGQGKKGVKKIGAMYTIPVSVWLYFGDEYTIKTQDVRNAMQKWAKGQLKISLEGSKESAQKIAKLVCNDRTIGIRDTVGKLSSLFYRQPESTETFAGELTELLMDVFQEKFGMEPNHTLDISVTPVNVATLIRMRMEGILALCSGIQISDIHLQWARFFHLWNSRDYIQKQEEYNKGAKGTPIESMFEYQTIETLMLGACVDLATAIGIGIVYRDRDVSFNKVAIPNSSLEFWKQHVVRSRVTSKISVPSIIVPRDFKPQLCINATVEWK